MADDVAGDNHVAAPRRSQRLKRIAELQAAGVLALPGSQRPTMSMEETWSFNSLQDEILLKILSAVVETEGNKAALCCMEVCKQWKRVAALAVTKLTTPRKIRLLPEVPMAAFGNLRTLRFNRARVPSWRWRHVFRALGDGCPLLSAVHFTDVKPWLDEKDILFLLRMCPSIRTLVLDTTIALRCFPSSSRMRSLESLTISSQGSLKSLYPFQRFTALHTLNICAARGLKLSPLASIPPTLRSLHLSGLRATCLPPLDPLSRLTSLAFEACPLLESLPRLQALVSLRHLAISHCSSLEEIPCLSGLSALRSLCLVYNSSMVEAPDVEVLPSLAVLDLHHCKALERVPGLTGAAQLERLNLEDCQSLELVSLHLAHVPQLKSLAMPLNAGRFARYVNGLSALTSLELKLVASNGGSLRKLPNLKELRLEASLYPYEHVLALPNLRSLGSTLTSLELHDVNCPFKNGMFNTLSSLERLVIFHTYNALLPNLNPLVRLRELKLDECEHLLHLPVNLDLPSLTSLEINRAPSMHSLCLPRLTSLRRLHIEDTYRLYSVYLKSLVNLRELHLKSGLIDHLIGLAALSQLTSIWVENQRLASLLGVGDLSALRTLTVRNCQNLMELPGVTRLTSLHSLVMHGHAHWFDLTEIKAWAQARTPSLHRFSLSWYSKDKPPLHLDYNSGSGGMSDGYESSESELDIFSRENYSQHWGRVYSSSSSDEEDDLSM